MIPLNKPGEIITQFIHFSVKPPVTEIWKKILLGSASRFFSRYPPPPPQRGPSAAKPHVLSELRPPLQKYSNGGQPQLIRKAAGITVHYWQKSKGKHWRHNEGLASNYAIFVAEDMMQL